MTATESTLPVPAAPPATDGEDTAVPNTLTAETPLQTPPDVPPVALREDEKILSHPEDGSDVVWLVQRVRRDDDDHDVIDYRTPGGDTDSYTVTDPATRFTVEVRR